MSQVLINKYLTELANLRKVSGTHRESAVREAFKDLLKIRRRYVDGAHSQGATLDELQGNLQEVIAMPVEDGEPRLDSEFVGVMAIVVA